MEQDYEYEVTIFDPGDVALSAIADAIAGHHILSLYPSGERRFPNISYFSPDPDPIYLVDTIQADRTVKRMFLRSAPKSVIVLQDTRALSLFLTALTMLINGELKQIFAVSEVPVDPLFQMTPDSERQKLQAAVKSGSIVSGGQAAICAALTAALN